jgi:hypothetical protein
MKWVWSMLVLVVLCGVAAVVWPASDREPAPPAMAPVAHAPPTPPTPPAPAPPPAPVQTASVPTAPAAPAPAKAERGSSPPPGGLALGLDRKINGATVLAGALVRNADGSITADGKYRIQGEGTREKPYRIDWDCLASAGKTFIPRLKENGIPQRVAMLDGAWVRIEGYVAFPLMLQETREVLCMLNQWDGCCIGVPPSPYDAIEVQLLEPLKPNRRHAFQFGTVTGRLRVDPMLVENWLVGLYRMEEAELKQEGL